ncbi:MAG: hypothetical protein JWN38_261 [Candidatus Saccharibacteria bacterium]|nr:hypothetical protein [Candidatus Saccharibacteria bacterium]
MEQFNQSELYQIELLASLGRQALDHIADAYGDGHSQRPEDLPYHNVGHTVRVQHAAGLLADNLALSSYDCALVSTVAAAHDVIHEASSGQTAEEASAAWLTERLRQLSMPPEDIEIAKLAIAATAYHFDVDGTLTQNYWNINYPNSRAQGIAACVASADMEALVAPHGPIAGQKIFEERQKRRGHPPENAVKDYAVFQGEQLRLLQTYCYPLGCAEVLFGNMRPHVYLHDLSLLQDMESGLVLTWDQVVQANEAFYTRARG